MKNILLFIFLGLAHIATAQTPSPDSLKVWVDAQFVDSTKQLTIQTKIANTSDELGYYYYQIRVTDATLRPANLTEKFNGVVLSLPKDTAVFFTKTITFDPKNDFNVYVYILEEDFVVADTFWNFNDALSVQNNAKPTPKAPQVYISKDSNLESEVYVINETRTPFGREFHRKFLENWKPPQGANGFWITIRETLTPGRFTILSVSLNNKELFQRYLIPKQKDIEDLAYATVDYLTLLLQNGTYDGSLTSDDLFGKLEETTGE
jgi:Curli assembly protein CsgE